MDQEFQGPKYVTFVATPGDDRSTANDQNVILKSAATGEDQVRGFAKQFLGTGFNAPGSLAVKVPVNLFRAFAADQ